MTWWLVVVFLLCRAGDLLTTYIALEYGNFTEANPFVNYLINTIGIEWAMVSNIPVSLFLIVMVIKAQKMVPWIWALLIPLSIAPVISNTIQLLTHGL